MATAYDITGGDLWYPADGIPHLYGGAIYVRLMRSYYHIDPALNGLFSVWKSTDDGVTWSMQGAEKGGEDNFQAIPGKGVVVGSVLFVAYYNHPIPYTTGAGSLRIARFDMSTDSWLSDWSGGPSLTDFCHRLNVGFGSDGNGVVCYSDWDWHTPTFLNVRQMRYVSISSAGAWGSPVNITNFLQTNNSYAEVVADTSNTEHVFNSESTSSWAYHLDEVGNVRVFSNPSPFSAPTSFVNARRPVLVTISGVPSIALGYRRNSIPGVATCPVGSATWTYTDAPALTGENIYGSCSRGNKLFAQFLNFSTLDVIKYGEYSDGAWSGLTTLTSGGPEFGTFESNLLGSNAVGVVAEDWNDGRAWFIRYAVGPGPAARYYAM